MARVSDIGACEGALGQARIQVDPAQRHNDQRMTVARGLPEWSRLCTLTLWDVVACGMPVELDEKSVRVNFSITVVEKIVKFLRLD